MQGPLGFLSFKAPLLVPLVGYQFPNHMLPWLLLVLGLGLLFVGAQVLIRGGAGLALRMGVSSLVVGLTVIAYGTSSPELVVSIQAGLSGNGAISAGNIIGSNICNILLILGAAALVHPIATHTQVIRREIPLMIGASIITAALMSDGTVGRIDGLALLAGIIVYTWLTLRDARQEGTPTLEAEFKEEVPAKPVSMPAAIGLVIGGLLILAVGSHIFVGAAVNLAESWGISQAVIGLTIVAIGTSLPELATSMVAAFNRNTDVAIGNVVGSNLFNLLGILGIAAVIQPLDVRDISLIDLGIMVASAVFLLPMIQIRKVVGRREGLLMLAAYVAYTWWLVQSSTKA